VPEHLPGPPLPGTTDPAFADDDGQADPTLAALLEAYAHGRARDDAVFTGVALSRLLVPMTSVAAETSTDAAGLTHDKRTEMALPVMVGTDGRRALPAFTGQAALAAWDPAARPVPVDAARAARGALDEGCDFLVVDPAGPVTWVADRAQVEALAAGRRTYG
jgi:hypothetical protein